MITVLSFGIAAASRPVFAVRCRARSVTVCPVGRSLARCLSFKHAVLVRMLSSHSLVAHGQWLAPSANRIQIADNAIFVLLYTSGATPLSLFLQKKEKNNVITKRK